jgi:hypothetical protein
MGKLLFGTVRLDAHRCVTHVIFSSTPTLRMRAVVDPSDGRTDRMEPERSELFQGLVARTIGGSGRPRLECPTCCCGECD